MGCVSSKVETPIETEEQRELRQLVEKGRDGLREHLLGWIKARKEFERHLSHKHMSNAERSVFFDLFLTYRSSRVSKPWAEEWDEKYRRVWDSLWETGSGLKWRHGKTGRDSEELFKLTNIGSNVSLTNL